MRGYCSVKTVCRALLAASEIDPVSRRLSRTGRTPLAGLGLHLAAEADLGERGAAALDRSLSAAVTGGEEGRRSRR